MKRPFVVAVFLLATIITGGMVDGSGAFAGDGLPPLPKNLEITPTDPNIGVIGGCSGVWSGAWDDDSHMDVKVVITQITAMEASGIYSWGGQKPGYAAISGGVTPEGTLLFVIVRAKDQDKRELTLTPVIENGNVIALKAKYKVIKGGFVYRGTLKKEKP